MYKHILVALNGQPESEQALKQAIDMARLYEAELTGFSVIEHLPVYAASLGEVDETVQEAQKYFNRVQENAAKIAQRFEVKMNTVTRAGNPAQVIINYAAENGVDLIVIGAANRHGLGSTADKVTENAACSVLIARVDLASIRVKDAMTREVITIRPEAPLSQLVSLMLERELKAIPVSEDGKIIGIITGGDLLSRAGIGLRLSIQRMLPAQYLSDYFRQLEAEGKTARDIMSSPVVSIDEEETIAKAAEVMAENHIKRLIVTGKDGKMTGIFSRVDVLAMAVSSRLSPEVFPSLAGSEPRTASDIMEKDVPTVTPTTSLSEVVNKIVTTPLRRVVVVDDQCRILGIIVDTNLIKVVHSGKPNVIQALLGQFSSPGRSNIRLAGEAADVMDRQIFTVQEDAQLSEVIQTMIDRRIKRLLVADRANHLRGMITREQILRMLIS
jgi:predicted transcriptional regulator